MSSMIQLPTKDNYSRWQRSMAAEIE